MLCRKEHMCNTKKYKISTAYLQKTKISSSSPLKSRISLALEILQFSRDLGKKQNQLTFFLTKHFLEKKNILCKRRFGISYKYTLTPTHYFTRRLASSRRIEERKHKFSIYSSYSRRVINSLSTKHYC